MTRATTVLRLVPLLLLAACASGFKSDAPIVQSYVLTAGAVQGSDRPLAATLLIARPTANPGLESDRIVVVHPDRRLDHYAASRWAGPLPALVEAQAVEAFRGGGAFAGVQDDRAPFLTDYVLRMTIRHFEATYAGNESAPLVRIALDCTVGRRADRAALEGFLVERSVPADGNRLTAVTAAFERALQEALASVHEQTVRAVAADQTP
jgi:cholesterol transport system auxiliary component